MANPYPANFTDDSGTVREAGAITFTDAGNQPGGSSAVVGVSVRVGSTVAIASGDKIPFNVTDFDTDSFWDAVAKVFTIPVGLGGIYNIGCFANSSVATATDVAVSVNSGIAAPNLLVQLFESTDFETSWYGFNQMVVPLGDGETFTPFYTRDAGNGSIKADSSMFMLRVGDTPA